MQDLQFLIKNLNKSEKKMARNFLTNYGNTGQKDTLSLKLFELLNKRTRNISNKDASIILFGKDEKNRIRVLKSRMKNKIYDALTTEVVLENQDNDVSIKMAILLKKKLVQFQTLYHSKKVSMKLILSLIDEIIEKATTYELYLILIDALNSKKQLLGFRTGMSDYSALEEIEMNIINAHAGLTKVVNFYYRISLMRREGITAKEEILNYFKNCIREGNLIVTTTKSNNSEHYLNLIKFLFYYDQKKYGKAIAVVESDIKLLKSSKAVYRKTRLGASYDYLCQLNLISGNFVQASAHAKEGSKCFRAGSINFIIAKELKFRSLLYNGNIKEADKVIKEMVKDYKDSTDMHRLSTHQFFLACFHFANGQFRACNRLLNNPFDFKQDKMGWEFNARVLSIMASLEQNKIEAANTKFTNLVRLHNRNKTDKKALSTRNKIIMKLIKEWLRSGGNKSIANIKDSKLLASLSFSTNKWDPLGSELIPFEKWIADKI